MSKRSLAPAAWMLKADTACLSAHALLARGDVHGAANRADYAMFAAARAALLASGVRVEPDVARTHSGLIGTLGRQKPTNTRSRVSPFVDGARLAHLYCLVA